MFSDVPESPTAANLADIFIEAGANLNAIDFSQCGEALKFIMEPNPEEEYAEFFDVSPMVHLIVSHIIELNWIWLPARPRWSYFKDDRILLIEMRSCMHEAPLMHLESIFCHFLRGFVHNPVLTTTTMSSRLTSTDTIPDIAIAIAVPNTDYNWIRKPLVIVECAFAQDTDSVLRKIKHEIAGQPEVLMVILVVIDEHQPYRSPERMSEAWQMLSQEASCRSDSSFASLKGDAARSYNHRVVIAGHTWCHLGSVRFHVWVRGNEPINIDDDDELHACGTLLPNRDMDAVDTMIENGMVMMRDSIAIVCQEVALGRDVTALQDTVVAALQDTVIAALQDTVVSFSPDWDLLLMKLNFAVAEAAYHRYHSWYKSSP
ncbi:uncharacterized protein HD556DRAFT_1439886 [Suillus plorans]|uniref:Uncharacterized protein n=1 Tax=Suillus plorans TaxID=116603 RepID=A0A9P7DN12_9AGAM|nr:uncharacterized protein HD556DRAFT_1439886 [Suillus plorans]KAG1798826.1 hypothetical protein HD556DRAFT_1439886 [Suillus plorans]